MQCIYRRINLNERDFLKYWKYLNRDKKPYRGCTDFRIYVCQVLAEFGLTVQSPDIEVWSANTSASTNNHFNFQLTHCISYWLIWFHQQCLHCLFCPYQQCKTQLYLIYYDIKQSGVQFDTWFWFGFYFQLFEKTKNIFSFFFFFINHLSFRGSSRHHFS